MAERGRRGPRPAARLGGAAGAAVFGACAVVAAGGAGAGGAWQTVAGTGKSGFGGDTYRSDVHDFAVETRLNSPWGLALDTNFDRLYVSDTVNSVVRSVDLQTGLMEVIAGSEWQGSKGDGGRAVEAEFHMPMGLALDAPGRILYVADTQNNRVRSVELDPGRSYQAEGAGALPAADGGAPATTAVQGAEVRTPCPATADALGNPTNTTPLLLGSGFCQGSTGTGYVAFSDVIDEGIDFHVLASSGAGLYELRFRYADRYDHAHAAGDRRLRVLVNGMAASHALLFRPTGNVQAGLRDKYGWAVLSASLTLLPPQRNIVRLELAGYGGPRVDMLYVVPLRRLVRTVAGTGAPGPPGCRGGCLGDFPTDRNALASPLRHPVGLAVDAVDKVLYIADSDNGRVLRLDIRTGMIRTIVGGANRSSTRDGEVGGALYGKLFRPTGLALDGGRRFLYIVDSEDNKVRRVDLQQAHQDRTIVTISGFGRQQAPFDHMLRAPQAIALDDAAGVVYVADRDNGRIRFADIDSRLCPLQVVSSLQCGHWGADQPECESHLGCCWNPQCLSGFNPDGRGPTAQPEDVLTKADQKAATPPTSFIRRGSGYCCHPNLRELSTLDVLESPAGVAYDARDGSLYVAQWRAHRVVRMQIGDSRCAADAMYC